MSAEPPPVTPPNPTSPSRFRGKRLLLALGLVLVAAAAAGGGLWWAARPALARSEALKAAAAGDFEAAEPDLRRALERNPSDSEVAEALARGYVKADDPLRGDEALTRWAELRPDDPEPHRLRFEFNRRHMEWARALPAGRRLLQLDPSDAALRRSVMNTAFSAGEFAEAEELCRALLAAAPKDPGLRSMLSQIRRARGDLPGAAAVLDGLLKEHPNYPPAMLARGVIYSEGGEPEKAIPLLREVMRIDPTRQRTAGYELSLALERAGKTEEARQVMAEVRRRQDVEIFRDAITARPDDLGLQVRLAEALIDDGHAQDGLNMLQAVLARDPAFRPAHRVLAAYFEKAGQPARAAEHRRLAGETP